MFYNAVGEHRMPQKSYNIILIPRKGKIFDRKNQRHVEETAKDMGFLLGQIAHIQKSHTHFPSSPSSHHRKES